MMIDLLESSYREQWLIKCQHIVSRDSKLELVSSDLIDRLVKLGDLDDSMSAYPNSISITGLPGQGYDVFKQGWWGSLLVKV